MRCIYYNRGNNYQYKQWGVNYQEALQKSKWNQKEAKLFENEKLLLTTSGSEGSEENELLRRCLVGRLCGGEEAPTCNETQELDKSYLERCC